MRGRRTNELKELDKLIAPLRDFCKEHEFSLVLRAADKRGTGPCLMMGSTEDIKADIDAVQGALINSLLKDIEKNFKELKKRK